MIVTVYICEFLYCTAVCNFMSYKNLRGKDNQYN